MKIYHLDSSQDRAELSQQAYAIGIHTDLSTFLAAYTDASSIEAIATKALSETIVSADDRATFIQLYFYAFSIGYGDAVIIFQKKPEMYKYLVSLDKHSLYITCQILALTWQRAYDALKAARQKANADELLSLGAGMDKLLSDDDNKAINDLTVHNRTISNVDISFAILRAHGEQEESLHVIITPDSELANERDKWPFTAAFYPRPGETFRDVAARVAKSLGVEPDEPVWTDDFRERCQ